MKLNKATGIILPILLSIQLFPSIAQELEFSVYEDPRSRFTVEYPSEWLVRPAETRFEEIDVAFTAQPSDLQNYTSVDIRIQEDVGEGDPETVANYLIDNYPSGVPDFNLQEGADCSKYTISDEQACSFIFSRTGQFLPSEYAVMQVVSLIDGNSYVIDYATSFENFDLALPIAEKMIGSFRLTESE